MYTRALTPKGSFSVSVKIIRGEGTREKGTTNQLTIRCDTFTSYMGEKEFWQGKKKGEREVGQAKGAKRK